MISCSWGPPQDMQIIRDACDYAEEHDAVVVGAAGNLNGMIRPGDRIYPAAYANVIAVVATTFEDRVWESSNYGEWTNIAAPGHDMISTFLRNGYHVASGTSMATPLTAGVVGLIRATYPELNADEATDLLYRGTDNIDNLNRNREGQFGVGRVNPYNSLMLGRIALGEITVVDEDEGEWLSPGETADIIISLTSHENVPAPEELTLELTSSSEQIQFMVGSIQFENIPQGEEVDNYEQPFTIRSLGEGQEITVEMMITATADGFSVRKEFTVELGPLSAEKESIISPEDFKIVGCYPNPFNNQITVSYQVDTFSRLQFNVYNLRGEMIYNSDFGFVTTGKNSLVWNGRDNLGNIVPTGTYFINLINQNSTSFRKILLMK